MWLKGQGPAPKPEDAARPGAEAGMETKQARALCCARCAHRITSESLRVEVDGSSVHTRTNPAGYTFRFGCFSRADGAGVEGAPSRDFTWFSGFAWRFAYCASCGLHLGWYFTGEGSFFALVLDRLAEPS